MCSFDAARIHKIIVPPKRPILASFLSQDIPIVFTKLLTSIVTNLSSTGPLLMQPLIKRGEQMNGYVRRKKKREIENNSILL